MFTGIVQGVASVVSVTQCAEILSLTLLFPADALVALQLGASVALNGCCLTVVSIQGGNVTFEIVQETVLRSTLGSLRAGDTVNFERSLRFGDEVGGHLVSGHVDTTGQILAIDAFDSSSNVTIQVDPAWTRFIFEKGYVALNGASLTVVTVDTVFSHITVSLIPETLKRTTFGQLGVGAPVNIEVDKATQAVVNTVERVLRERALRSS